MHTDISARRKYLIELWDIGGREKYKVSRGVFYHGVDGILLVHDLTNKRSYANLQKWCEEIADVIAGDEYSSSGSSAMGRSSFFASAPVGAVTGSVAARLPPVLVVGTKVDLVSNHRSRFDDQEEWDADSTEVSAVSGFIDRHKFDSFFNRIVGRRGQKQDPSASRHR